MYGEFIVGKNMAVGTEKVVGPKTSVLLTFQGPFDGANLVLDKQVSSLLDCSYHSNDIHITGIWMSKLQKCSLITINSQFRAEQLDEIRAQSLI